MNNLEEEEDVFVTETATVQEVAAAAVYFLCVCVWGISQLTQVT